MYVNVFDRPEALGTQDFLALFGDRARRNRNPPLRAHLKHLKAGSDANPGAGSGFAAAGRPAPAQVPVLGLVLPLAP